jgi:hypothetical protein
MIDIEALVKEQIDEEKKLIFLVASTDLDENSKVEVLRRTHQHLRRINNLVELEDH